MPPQIRRPEIKYPKIDQSAPSSLIFAIFFSPYYLLLGSGSCGRNLRKALISAASQMTVTVSAEIAKDARFTESGVDILDTMTKNAPISTTLEKYEKSASAITAIGSISRLIL
jgi:hypothetical protein